MNIKPLGKRVLIEFLPSATKTPGGLHLPQGTEDRSHVAIVVALGTGILHLEPDDGPKVGDKVIVSKFQGIEVEVDGKPMRIVDMDSILGVTPAPELIGVDMAAE